MAGFLKHAFVFVFGYALIRYIGGPGWAGIIGGWVLCILWRAEPWRAN